MCYIQRWSHHFEGWGASEKNWTDIILKRLHLWTHLPVWGPFGPSGPFTPIHGLSLPYLGLSAPLPPQWGFAGSGLLVSTKQFLFVERKMNTG